MTTVTEAETMSQVCHLSHVAEGLSSGPGRPKRDHPTAPGMNIQIPMNIITPCAANAVVSLTIGFLTLLSPTTVE